MALIRTLPLVLTSLDESAADEIGALQIIRLHYTYSAVHSLVMLIQKYTYLLYTCMYI